ncbi:MAG: hypothetical protein KDI65_11555 [Alphaproteobacteria bacterium]|nr:hypothetical protein [Alphaproteobacteria bacterium]
MLADTPIKIGVRVVFSVVLIVARDGFRNGLDPFVRVVVIRFSLFEFGRRCGRQRVDRKTALLALQGFIEFRFSRAVAVLIFGEGGGPYRAAGSFRFWTCCYSPPTRSISAPQAESLPVISS